VDVLITEELSSPAIDRLAKRFSVVTDALLWKDPARLKERILDARALMIRNQTRVTSELLASARSLKAIGRVGVGLDNIDLQAAKRRGVVVIAPLSANAVSVAELTMALILALARKLPASDRSTRSGEWDRKTFTGIEVDGKTLAICGLGRIGRMVALRGKAFGLKLVVYDPFVKHGSPALDGLDAMLVEKLEQALATADFVTVHSPLTPETKHLFNERAFGAMKRGSFFVNTSRGGVMDEKALLRALKSSHLAGAALDVREIEPPEAHIGFESLDNVILTPHVGAFTHEAQARTFEAVCDDLDQVLRGEAPRNLVA
jgi:D-3-phosphoglycerate dehydrogenase